MTKATPPIPAGPIPQDLFARQEALARGVLEAEMAAIGRVRIDASFHRAVQLILDTTGPEGTGAAHATGGAIVVSGLGKSGLVGQKISATLASTGTPSHFLHPVEAMHGDLGRVRRGDAVLLLSYTGNTDEVVTLASVLRQDGVPAIALVGKAESDLGRLATVALAIGDVTEACPLNLAPTASTTAMLALGDALALAVAQRRGFGVDDFRKVHPGGGLGRQLMPVVEAMRLRAGVNLPLIPETATVEQAFTQAESYASSGRRVGAILMVDPRGLLVGLFTDGDLRRTLLKHGNDAWRQPIARFMTRTPRTLADTDLVRDAVRIAREYRFDEIPVVDGERRPVGMIDVMDLVALKVIDG